MRKLLEIRKIALLMALLLIFTFSTQGTVAYMVDHTPDFINTFIPGARYLNSLIISKMVEHPLGADYVIPEGIHFQFLVELGAEFAGKTISTTAGDHVADHSGRIVVSVDPGSNIGILDIPEGTQVTVTEMLVDGNGFTVKGEATRVTTIEEGANLDYINIYAPKKVEPATVSITGTKILEGRDWAEGDSFSFTLEQETANDQWTVLGTQTVTYDASNSEFNRFDFAELVRNLEFTKVGEYYFRMSEITGNAEHIDYDKTVNYFTIRVTDVDMDGKLEIGQVIGAQNVTVSHDNATGVYNVNVTFNNTYNPPEIPTPEDLILDILVDKTVKCSGEGKIGPEGFLFLLQNLENDDLNQVLKTDAEGNALHQLTFTAADLGKTFHYRLTEVNDNKPGVTYSTAEYLIDISISLDEQNNLLKADITMNGEATRNIVGTFVNEYEKPDVSAPTGDTAEPILLIALMVLSGAGILIILIGGRKRKKNENEEDT